jgi:uncharacterized protein DUF6252
MFKPLRIGLFLPALLLLLSCGKEQSVDTLGSTGQPNTAKGKITMTINGKPWVADKNAFASMLQGITGIYGQSHDGKTFLITLFTTTTGEYHLDQNSMHAAAWSDSMETSSNAYTTNQGTTAADAGGKVFLTLIDAGKKTISGTFHFNMFRDQDNGRQTIVDGKFENLSYGTPDPTDGTGGTGGGTGGTGGGTGGGTTTGNSMVVSIDGSVYTPKTVMGALIMENVMISGTQTDGTKAVGFTVPKDIIPGSYELSLFTGYVAVYNVGLNDSYAAESGKLVITEHNKATKKMRGTFAFKAINLQTGTKKELTNGSFSVTYD